MTTSSKSKTGKTGYIAAAFAAVLSLGSCAIADFSVSIGEIHVEFEFAAPAPKPEPQPKAPSAKKRVMNRLKSDRKRGGRMLSAAAMRLIPRCGRPLRSEGKNVAQIARALSTSREGV